MTPQTTFDFGDWKPLDDYVAMTCEHFSNSMHIVFDQVGALKSTGNISPAKFGCFCTPRSAVPLNHRGLNRLLLSWQVQRWRCGRYRPDRTLVAPLSVADATAAPPQDAERPLTLTFRGSCTPDGGKEPAYAGKRLRALLVKLLANSGALYSSHVSPAELA